MAELARAESVYQNYGKYYIVGIDYNVNWQSVITNSSNITLTLWLEGLQYANASWSSGTASLYGDTTPLNVYSVGPYQRIVLKQVTVDILHDANGEKTVYVSGSYNTAPGLYGNVGGTLHLPKINRKASMTSNIDIILKGIATEQNITFNNSGNFFLKLDYMNGNNNLFSKKIGQKNSSDITFNEEELIKLYQSSTYSIKLTTYTDSNYNNSIGEEIKTGNIVKEGIVHIQKTNTWKEAIPFVRKNGKWKLTNLNIYKNTWKRSK